VKECREEKARLEERNKKERKGTRSEGIEERGVRV
jgi:hypothetical protein